MAPDPDSGDTRVHEGDLYSTLLTVSDDAKEQAVEIIRGAVHAAAPELSESNSPVLLDGRRAEDAIETILSTIEGELRRLCTDYDYRQFLHVSRLCSAVPTLMWQDANHEDRRVRTLSADRWILRCAPRSLSRDYVTMVPNDYRLQMVPNSLCCDAAKLHVLANFHQRMVVESSRFNFMRLVSARNGLRGSTLRLHWDPTVGWNFHSDELVGALLLFNHRDQHENGALAWWGMADVEAGNEFFALSADPNPTPGEAGGLFNPRAISLDAWLEYGRRFSTLFERDVGMPAEHFWAISRALGSLGLNATVDDGGRLQRWANLTATIPVRREDLLGGRLMRLAADELGGSSSSVNTQDLNRSLGHYLRLASSSVGTPALGVDRAPTYENVNTATLRNPFYPYMIHGTDEHDYWVVDYLMTIPFVRAVVNEIEFSGSASTTFSENNDAFVRTSVFDAHLAKELAGIPGYEAAFCAFRETRSLPNVTFSFNDGAENREIDVPVRLGEVLVAVQTWTPAVNERTMAGERRAMERRWNNARDKLRDTDQKYTDYLLHSEEGRERMLAEDLRYILPVVCGPYAEPLVSLYREFWLRYPQFRRFGAPEVPEGAVPRILTPLELTAFLEDACEQELRTICEQHGWAL